jgi:serine/threonine protein kinase
MQHMVYDIGLAPAINTAYLSSIGGVVVMDKLDRTVGEVIKTYLTNEFNTDERATMRVSQILSEEWGREWAERLKARARDIANDVADVLHRLHQHDLWHQDTHTGNFMYTRSGELKCIDFGRTKLIPRNQILKIETREPTFDQTPFEFEYFQFKRSMNALPNYFRNTFEGNTAKHFANEFKNAAKEVWALRRDDELRELEAL